MRELAVYRNTLRREARIAAGRHPHAPTLSVAGLRPGSLDHELLVLPEDIDNLTTIQQADGSFFMMIGFSALSGGDPLK